MTSNVQTLIIDSILPYVDHKTGDAVVETNKNKDQKMGYFPLNQRREISHQYLLRPFPVL